jgi:nucleotide-binding universal stress UspA family protein
VTRVLIAVDETDESVEAARVAHQLFGDDAEYLVVNVSDPLANGMAWGYVYPIVPPIAAYPVMMPAADAAGTVSATGGADDESPVEHAEHRAQEVAAKADLGGAETVGEVGDAATAIIDAADEHKADVIVVGSHERSWFDRLMSASVTKRVLSDATIPVLVVK